MECAECHDHKYDPFETREFYQMIAFFNQVPENPLQRDLQVPPTIAAPTPEQEKQLAVLADKAQSLEAELKVAAGQPEQEAALKQQWEAAQKARDEFAASIPQLRVMTDVPERRPTYVLIRGDFRQLGEEVLPGVPASLGVLPGDMEADRLALARWITDRANPLTARVTVNRLWQMVFGTGLVKTSGWPQR
jgi:inorganic triphosphatase YgiF